MEKFEVLDLKQTNDLMYPIIDALSRLTDAAAFSSRDLHAAVKIWEEELRRPVAVIARFDSIDSLRRAVTFEFVEISTAISRGYYKPLPRQPRIRPSSEFLLLAVLLEREKTPEGNRHIVRFSASFKIPAALGSTLVFGKATYENGYLSKEDCIVDEPGESAPKYKSARGLCSGVNCDQEGAVVKFKCSRCTDARYHSAECQRRHWKYHKMICGFLGRSRKILSSSNTPFYMDMAVLKEDGSGYVNDIPFLRY
eukprot:jgi/Mesvir1/15103/Mv14743-RA.1